MLRGKAKLEFLRRMAAGRRAAGKNPRRRRAKNFGLGGRYYSATTGQHYSTEAQMRAAVKRYRAEAATEKTAARKRLAAARRERLEDLRYERELKKAKAELARIDRDQERAREKIGAAKEKQRAGAISEGEFARMKARMAGEIERDQARRQKLLAKVNPSRRRKKKKGRRNPDDGAAAAARMFKKFHGAKSTATKTVKEMRRERIDLALCGTLHNLTVNDGEYDQAINYKQTGVTVCVDPEGKQLYFVGGDQALTARLDALYLKSAEAAKDLIDLGEVTRIEYFTTKDFHDFAPTVYWHLFGEVSGIKPRLGYDALSKRIFLTGGNYLVKRAGIID